MKNPVAKNLHKFNRTKVEPDKTKTTVYPSHTEFLESIGCTLEEQRTNNDWWYDEWNEIEKYLDEHQ